jgi:hypothetical protein
MPNGPNSLELPVEVKVRPEFGAGGALGRVLLLQDCRRKKDTSTINSDEISQFLELLEKQQQEHSSFDACSGIENRHGVGYTKQNAVVRPKEAIEESLMFGVFRKKTWQE